MIHVKYRIEHDDYIISLNGNVSLALPTKEARALASALYSEDAKPNQLFDHPISGPWCTTTEIFPG